ncbi:hypothetical protein BGHDH14_bgh05596 [Blumeria hordei DH14]|uniref:2EXR domain-containing protein n=1 Tax=Blumeria graminis f. sp. hordei (strain DH14) TaxID=546991 RepID=N1JMJ9_BLUG1|nr:hypothetical protein BGHDH14_bgh05596 [Blumeria hordei DH14]
MQTSYILEGPAEQAPASFTLFPFLPVELRLKIYTYSIPDSRLVPLILKTSHSFKDNSHGPNAAVSSTVIPPLLHVCHEARQIAREHYSLSFHHPGSQPRCPATVWWRNDGSDIALLGHNSLPSGHELEDPSDHFKKVLALLHHCSQHEPYNIFRIAIPQKIFHYTNPRSIISVSGLPDLSLREFWVNIITKLPSINEVLFVQESMEVLAPNPYNLLIVSPVAHQSERIKSKPTLFKRHVAKALSVVLKAYPLAHPPSWNVVGSETQEFEPPNRLNKIVGYYGGHCRVAKMTFASGKDIMWWGLYNS